MIGFWVAAALVVVLVLALLFRPFLLKTSGAGVSRRQLNTAIYRDQLARLERDRAENMLAETDYAQARDELQRRVIDDTRDEDAAATLRAPRKTMLAVGLALPLLAIGLYALVGNPVALDPGAYPSNASQHAASPQDIERMVEGLAQKLEKDPDNRQGWAMLARSYKMLGRNAEAEQAFEKAGAILDNDAQLLAAYADLAASNANGNFAGKPMMLIEKALKVDPQNPMALWLAGTASYRSNQFETAIRIWERLVQQLEPDSDDARMLQDAIGSAYAALGKNAPKASPALSSSGNAGEATRAQAGAGASVRGQVELDAALKAKAAPGDTVMVIARIPGMRMPVAVVRVNASELPLQFTLDDSLAMSPQARISAATQVEVEARISKSGMAQPDSGDLMSAVQTVKVGASGVKLVVNKVRP
ncbi:MAG: c-type cytochrome biogenesis protein CcmI [Burkholderiales bacterium]|nr:c-type cytochrome biogenesis protein CcmI [Burkholderiales bacterium]